MRCRRTLEWILIGIFLLGVFGSLSAQNHVYVKTAPSGPQITTTLDYWTDITHLALSFEQIEAGFVSIAFSAEAYTGGPGRMFVRALVNGTPASPSDVLLVTGTFRGVCAFTFVTFLDPGSFEVKMQWRADTGETGYLGDRTMVITSAPWYTFTQAAPSGGPVETASSSLTEIPDLACDCTFGATGYGILGITGEAYASGSTRMFVAGSANGQSMNPSDVVFTVGGYNSTRAFTFVQGEVPPTDQSFRLQWKVDAGGTGYMGDRTITFAFSPFDALTGGMGGFKSISPPSGPDVSTNSGSWADVPDLNLTVDIPENANVTVSLSAEVETTAGERMFVRAKVGDQVLSPTDVIFSSGTFIGTTRFNFVAEGLPAGTVPVSIQWHVDGGGTGYMGDRNLMITAFSAPGTGVDDGDKGALPETMALEPNYPNPFNAATVIGYQVSEPGMVSLKLYNSRGEEIQTLVNEEKTAGKYQVVFTGDDLPTGIYICKFLAGSQVLTRKMLLLR